MDEYMLNGQATYSYHFYSYVFGMEWPLSDPLRPLVRASELSGWTYITYDI